MNMIQKGNSIAQANNRLQTDWQTLNKQNSGVLGGSAKNGTWHLREGANAKVNQKSFFRHFIRKSELTRKGMDSMRLRH